MAVNEAPTRWRSLGFTHPRENYICIMTLSKSSSCENPYSKTRLQDLEHKFYFHMTVERHLEILDFQHYYEIFIVLKEMREGGKNLLDHLKSQGPLSEETSRKLFLQLTLVMNYFHDTGYTNDPFYLLQSTLLDEGFNIKYIHTSNCLHGAFKLNVYIKTLKAFHMMLMGKVLYFMITGELQHDNRLLEESVIERLPVSLLCKQLLTGLMDKEISSTELILEHDWMIQILA